MSTQKDGTDDINPSCGEYEYILNTIGSLDMLWHWQFGVLDIHLHPSEWRLTQLLRPRAGVRIPDGDGHFIHQDTNSIVGEAVYICAVPVRQHNASY